MNLEIDHLTFGYERSKPVLKNITLAFRENSITALAGVNGCGKSTLLKCIAALHTPDKGCVKLDGVPLQRFNRRNLARRLAYLPQNPQIPAGFTAAELVLCGRYPHDTPHRINLEKSGDALDSVGISHLASRQLSTLSGGECQRCYMAMALAQEPEILLLDEPFSALDPAAAGALFKLLLDLKQQYGLTVVIVLHDINRAIRYSDRIIGMKSGEIAFDLAAAKAADEIANLYDLSPDSCIECVDGSKFYL